MSVTRPETPEEAQERREQAVAEYTITRWIEWLVPEPRQGPEPRQAPEPRQPDWKPFADKLAELQRTGARAGPPVDAAGEPSIW